MANAPLGSRQIQAIPDDTGLNPGNWTAHFTDSVFNVQVSYYEVYHFYVSTQGTGLISFPANPTGGQFQVWINNVPWDNEPYSANNSWDPSQPMLLQPGDQVDFYFSFGTGSAPLITAWLRYNDGS